MIHTDRELDREVEKILRDLRPAIRRGLEQSKSMIILDLSGRGVYLQELTKSRRQETLKKR